MFHLCKTDNIKSLESMCTVRRVAEDDNIVSMGKLDKLRRVMGAVAIQEDNTSMSTCLLLGLSVKILNHPLQPELVVCPAILRNANAIGNIKIRIGYWKVGAHDALDTLSLFHPD